MLSLLDPSESERQLSELDLIPVLKRGSGFPLPVHARTVGAAEILHEELPALVSDRCMSP
jgi:hypothetical protein